VRKRLFRLITQSSPYTWLLDGLEGAYRRRPNLLHVLTYHRVGDAAAQPGCYPRIMVSPKVFEEQMRYLAANYHVISMSELLKAYWSDATLPPRTALITFDDAYRDFAEAAWPILQRYGLPVTLFVPTAFPDQPARLFWWDQLYHALCLTARQDDLATSAGNFALGTLAQREEAFSRLRDYVKRLPHGEAMAWVAQVCNQLDVDPPAPSVLSWQALRQLAQAGVTLGAHTQTHPLLNRISAEGIRTEITGSLRDLQREAGSSAPILPIFAYPSGECNDEVVHILKEEGFALAFTTMRGANALHTFDPLRIRRYNVGQHTTLPVLRTQLLAG
jgi:peptidoglycan/xylan/chitin deacetylase (PgdA/CDA1 family)